MLRLIHPGIKVEIETMDGFSGTYRDLRFIVSESKEMDGELWLHASVSRRDKTLPTYHDLMTLKSMCIGEDKTALQIFPPKDKHIDIAGKMGTEVLHLWACLSKEVTPDFTRGGNSI